MTMMQMDLFTFAVERETKLIRKTPENFRICGRMPAAPAARIAANLAAIRVLKESDRQKFSDAEKNTLAGFSGWGGLTEIFMEGNPHYDELRNLLTGEEYETAAASMLDSYYTPENLIRFMWRIARDELGIQGGKVAELGCGTGNFFGGAPNGNCWHFFGVELDRISGRIAQALYPNAEIRIASLEKVKLPTDVDLVIGNVPFG